VNGCERPPARHGAAQSGGSLDFDLPAADMRAMGETESRIIGCRVAIVGGGLAGMTLAARLGQAGIDTVVIDRADPATLTDPGYDARTTAISYGSRRILAESRLWDAVADRAEPILEVRVADGDAPFHLRLDHAEMAGESAGQPFGHIVENRDLRIAQFARIAALPTVRLVAPVSVADLAVDAGQATLRLSEGRAVRAELVVGADGRMSFVRRAAGIASSGRDYGQTGLVFALTHAELHGGVAVEHFRAAGPFAVLPMRDAADGGHRSAVVWIEKPAAAEALAGLPADRFEALLRPLIGDRLGRFALSGPRHLYPIALVHARRYTAPRTALIADAAHGIHPIAAQGLNLGLRDIAVLAPILIGRARCGLDLGAADPLSDYGYRRRPDNTATILATDALDRLFSNARPPLRLGRGLGLALVGRLPPVRRLIMRQAMGLGLRSAASDGR
jgi:2-octaprenyl-6-methoxyphenol hydroxylase